MANKKKLISQLNDGKTGAKTGKILERALAMRHGNTNETTRALISNCILGDKYPIGSCNNGYFLIDSQQELDDVVNSLQSRIDGIQARMIALKKGWLKRSKSRNSKGNWPK